MHWEIVRLYKVPLLLGIAGLLFFIIASVLSVANVFTHGEEKIDIVKQNMNASANFAILVVDMQGAVNNPGTYTLNDGSRIEDLIQMAGGLREDADGEWISKHINRAQMLTDGGKVYIPFAGEKMSGDDKQVPGSGMININTASKEELETLPGIGEKSAEKIISSRPYGVIEELREKNVVGDASYEKIKDLISVL